MDLSFVEKIFFVKEINLNDVRKAQQGIAHKKKKLQVYYFNAH